MSLGQSETSLYLFAIARASALEGFSVAAFDGAGPARVERLGAFDAVVADVPTAMFSGEEAQKRLEDVAVLTPLAARHDAVIHAAMLRGAVAPVGFGGVFSSGAAIAEAIEPHASEIERFFDEAAGCSEWSMKVWTDRSAAIERAKRAIAGDRAGAGSGAAYLLAKRLAADAERRAEDDILAAVDDLIDAVGEPIVDVTERSVAGATDDAGRWLVAHVALLVRDDRRAVFDAALDEASAATDAIGVDLELSGPWPAYSFGPRFGAEADAADVSRAA